MRITPITFKQNGKPPVFKKRELFKKTDEPAKIDFKAILKELINPTNC